MTKKWLTVLTSLFITLALHAESLERTMYIHPNKVNCMGVGNMQCLQIRYSDTALWSTIYGSIEGFEHREGYAYTLLVREEKIANPPADAPGIRRILVKVINEVKSDAMNITGDWKINEVANSQGSMMDLRDKQYAIALTASSIKGKICNTFSGAYVIQDDGTVKPGFLRSTRMMCSEIASENAVMKALGNANKALLENDTLTLLKDNSVLIRFTRKQNPISSDFLSGKVFRVTEMKAKDGRAQKGPEGSFMQFDMSRNHVGGKGGCNNYFGEAIVKYTGDQQGEIQFSKIGSTMMACDNLSEEQQFFKNLEAATHVELKGDELLIKKGDEILVTCKADK